MSYTNYDLVRNHIRIDEMSSLVRENVPITLTGTDWVNLPGQGINSGSVVVKSNYQPEPIRETITLSDSAVVLQSGPVVPQSTAVASDSSLGTIYEENVDYLMDYSASSILRLSGGAISSGSIVSVWYFKYKTYSEAQDYQVDYQNGRIRRLSGGDINSGQMIMIDFELLVSGREEEILESAINHANSIVEARVDPSGQFGASPILQTAATFLAVSLVCRMAALTDLSTNIAERQKAAEWLKMAAAYRSDFNELILNFHPEAGRLNPPTLT